MSWVAVGVGGGAVVGGAMSSIGGKNAAGAAEDAARAQMQEARRAYGETKSIVDPATIQGMASLDRDIKNQERNLTRQEQMISQLDPTIIEASQQALKLLRGDKASSMGPLENQRAMQRQKLVNTLRSQLGPGAETSSAGMKALTAFDQESSSLFSNAQQQALGMMGNISSQFSSQRPDMLREISGLSGFGQAQTNLQFQRAAALSNARQGLQQSAGGSAIGVMMQGQQQQAMGNQLLGAATTLGTAYLTGPKT